MPTHHGGMPGHYQSLLQLMGPLSKNQPLGIDEGLPSLAETDGFHCQHGCEIVSLSAAARKRQKVLFHFKERQRRQHKCKSAAQEPPDEKEMSFLLQRRCGSMGLGSAPSVQFIHQFKTPKILKHITFFVVSFGSNLDQ